MESLDFNVSQIIMQHVLKWSPRDVAKEILSHLSCSLSQLPFFLRDLEQFSSPVCWNTLNVGLPSLPFTRFHFNYFTHYSGTDTRGSQEFIPNFSFRQFNMVHILNDCRETVRNLKTIRCSLPSDHLRKSRWQSSISQPANFASSWQLTTTP